MLGTASDAVCSGCHAPTDKGGQTAGQMRALIDSLAVRTDRARAQRAAGLGLLTMLPEQEGRDPRVMATALRHLTEQPPPSTVDIPGLLDGMLTVNRLARKWLDKGRAGCFAARELLEA